MFSLIPEVHLFVCLDSRISPGAILHCLDLARAQDWQQETVLICDESWRSFVNIDQPVLYVDKDKLFGHSAKSPDAAEVDYLDQFLEQMDSFEIKKITQVGDLSWGRWLVTYFEKESPVDVLKIDWQQSDISSLELVNDIAEELSLDLSLPVSKTVKASSVYVDPYQEDELSPCFLDLIKGVDKFTLPSWLRVVCREEDVKTFESFGLGEALVDVQETEMSLFNQSVLCFSDSSPFCQTSRSYNIALFQTTTQQSLFVPGDIHIEVEEEIHVSELWNILAYWKAKRLKELAFQWLNMGVEIHHIESFHSRIVKRNLQNYSSDLFHCQTLIKNFLAEQGGERFHSVGSLIDNMRSKINNDPYALSFSLKILLMIVERMMASAHSGERLFQRLGSDYHRIVVGETLIEGLIETAPSLSQLDINEKLKQFFNYLVKVDYLNDQTDRHQQSKESL